MENPRPRIASLAAQLSIAIHSNAASMETPRPRIVSLLPSITEVLCELGLSEHIVGITHECDHPPELISSGRAKVVTTSDINPRTMSQAEIHEAVCGSLKNGQSLYGIQKEVLQNVKPDLIFTQSLCDVCAVSYPVVLDTCAKLLGGGMIKNDDGSCTLPNASESTDDDTLNPKVISLEPENLEDCLKTFHVAAKAFGSPELIAKANEITSRMDCAFSRIRETVKDRPRPKVAFIEWHDPIFCGGHWIVDMLEIAGGDYVMPVKHGDRSMAMTNEDFVKLDPDVILIGPCGFSLERTVTDTISILGQKDWFRKLRAVQNGRLYCLDGNSYYARPGPRLLQGTGIMATCIHNLEDELSDLAPPAGFVQVTPELLSGRTTISKAGAILSASPKLSICNLRPHPNCALFVAWNGVITLVFCGFPDSLVLAKERLGMFLPDLATEKFGSMWPKTTLGAVNDSCDGLSLAEFSCLRDICLEFSEKISVIESVLPVKSLPCVAYECRGLEKLKDRNDVELSNPKKVLDNPSSEEINKVDGVVSEWEILEEYLPRVNAPGSRIGSYREGKDGSTCVAFLDIPFNLRIILVDFKMAVDTAFPGRYSWMAESSLHCTLRSLDCK